MSIVLIIAQLHDRCLFISHWSEDGVFWALTYLIRRLKGILNNMAGDDASALSRSSRKGTAGADARAAAKRQSQKGSRKRKRKRSRSVPNMQVKMAEKKNGAEDSKAAAEDRLEPTSSETRIVRAASMDTSRAKGRKKSLAAGGSSGFKHFKNFVESKILSKSSQDVVANGSAPDGTSGVANGGLKATGGSAKSSFQRRSSRTSVAEFDPLLSSPTRGNNR